MPTFLTLIGASAAMAADESIEVLDIDVSASVDDAAAAAATYVPGFTVFPVVHCVSG